MTFRSAKLLFAVVLILAALVACDTAIPTAPPITVNITAVDNTTALAQGVREALDATGTAYAHATETVLAQGGVTLTPSVTPSITPSLTPSSTRFVTETPTPTASDTMTPTYAPFLTNTPGPEGDTSNAWVRVVNAWRDITSQSPRTEVDVYLNNERISRALPLGGQTSYFRVLPGSVRVTLRTVDPNVMSNAILITPPLISTVISIPPGGVASVVAVNRGKGLELINVPEDPTPINSGLARLTILQANPTLLESNVLLTSEGRALAYNLQPGDLVGPFDLPPGNYPAALYDALKPEQLIMSLPNPIRLSSRVNYLMVFVAPSFDNNDLTEVMLFSGITRRMESDLSVRFVNISTRDLTILMDSRMQVEGLPVGAISDAVPASQLGAMLRIQDPQGRVLLDGQLGPWSQQEDRETEKIVLFTDGQTTADFTAINMGVLSQDAKPSAINANIRLIHALPNTRPLTLQIRPVQTRDVLDAQGTPIAQQIGTDEIPWISAGDAGQAGSASEYSYRTPQIYDVRVVLSGSNDVIGNSVTVQLLPGGVYDFIALPGADTGSFSLGLIEPDTQIGGTGTVADNATAVAEAVDATLTAQAPQTTATPTRADTATPTRTPFPTNTPRPTNTPNVPPPSIKINPEPPVLAYGSLTVSGKDLAPGLNFIITIDNETQPAARGKIGDDGTLAETTVNLSKTIVPGSHTLTVCVDCATNKGLHQVLYVVFIAADPNVTPTPAESPTPTPTETPAS